jgi:hypothetical protein
VALLHGQSRRIPKTARQSRYAVTAGPVNQNFLTLRSVGARFPAAAALPGGPFRSALF